MLRVTLSRMCKFAVAILILLALSACGKLAQITDPMGGLPPVDPSATFTRVQNEVFTPNCTAAGCHDSIIRQQNLQLTAGAAYAQLVGVSSEQMPSVQRVRPGDHPNSYLYRKLIGSGITGERMPSGGVPLDAAKIQLVRDWIRRGAPND
jgi:hypothetical protein